MQQQMNIDLKQAENVGCPECDNLYFSPIAMIKKLSAIASPTGQELKFPIQCFQCNDCKHVIEPPQE